VKNLENIQGDERDIIYFSVTFGPDIKGKVSHNFGPMNQDGGPRRLNVAITRARLEMRVFSSLLPEMIDLSRTDALGVKDLKHFIEFASRGYSALGEAVEAPLAKFDSPFEEAVAKRLTEKGWTLHSQVGVSGFKIDLGVVNPEFPGAYIAGIECDGATYHRSASVRDRDFLREKVLSGLGWNMLRVWSIDWWLNPQGATVRLHNALQLIIEEEKRKHDKEEKVIPIQPYLPDQEDKDETTLIRARLGNLQDTGAEMDQSDEVIEIPFGDEELEPSGLATSIHRPSNRIRFDDYKVTDLFDVTDLDPDKFYDQSYNHKLIELIDRIVCCEGPIREDVLVQRISRAHNFKRSGNLINKRILALLPEKYQIRDDGSFKFIWQEDTDISEWNVFRLQSPQYIRPAEQICFEELSVLAIEANNLFSSFDDALIWMTQRLNLKRLRGSSRQRVFKALEQYRN